MTLTIGILQTGSVQPEYQADFGDYPAMFEDLLRRTAPDPSALAFRVYRCEHGDDMRCRVVRLPCIWAVVAKRI